MNRQPSLSHLPIKHPAHPDSHNGHGLPSAFPFVLLMSCGNSGRKAIFSYWASALGFPPLLHLPAQTEVKSSFPIPSRIINTLFMYHMDEKHYNDGDF